MEDPQIHVINNVNNVFDEPDNRVMRQAMTFLRTRVAYMVDENTDVDEANTSTGSEQGSAYHTMQRNENVTS
jgi:hypothetical protein